MHLLSDLLVILSCLLTLCQTQTYNNYSVQRRNGYGYSQPSSSSYRPATAPLTSSYYNPAKSNYPTSTATKTSNYYSSFSKPSYNKNSYYKSSATRNSYPYSTFAGSYTPYRQATTTTSTTTRRTTARPYTQSSSQNYYRNSLSSTSQKASDFYNKQYLTNSYNTENYNKDNNNINSKGKYRISKADSENAKFVGAANQEDEDDSGRTAHLKRRKFHRRFGAGGLLANPCIPFGRDAGKAVTPPPKEQGRILWDVNVYNIYPQTSAGLGCGGYGGLGALGAAGAGLLADPIAPPYYPPGAGISTFLSLFAPGILQNSLAVTARPPLLSDYAQNSNDNNDLQNDPNVDPNYNAAPAPLPVRRPNRVFYDSAGAPPITPGQLVGGISTTVNGIIQQLTGNVQPVYGG